MSEEKTPYDRALTTTGHHGALVTKEQAEAAREIIRQQLARDCTNAEFEYFMAVARHTGLDPITRQIYAVSRWDPETQRNRMGIQIGIDGYRSFAESTGEYEGQTAPQWCGPDGVWKDVWLSKDPPAAARVGVLRRGFREPTWGVARYDAYVQLKRDKTPNTFWSKMADNQLAKVAEALAIRKAFPRQLSGTYTDAEMAQATTSPEPTWVEDLNAGLRARGKKVGDLAVALGGQIPTRDDWRDLIEPKVLGVCEGDAGYLLEAMDKGVPVEQYMYELRNQPPVLRGKDETIDGEFTTLPFEDEKSAEAQPELSPAGAKK